MSQSQQWLSSQCKGFSLIELMIAIVLGLVLSSALITVYLQSKRNYLIEDEMARMQENGRFALNLLKRELTLAGFYAGEPAVLSRTPAPDAPDCGAALNWGLDPHPVLDLINDFTAPSLTTVAGIDLDCLSSLVTDIEPGTDLVSVKRTAGEPTLANGVLRGGATGAEETQWYLRVADYGAAIDWRYIGAGGNFPSPDAVAGSRVDYWETYANIYFVRSYSNSGDAIPTLCTERLSANSMGPVECIVEGVEDLQLELGIDADLNGVPDFYTAAPVAVELEAAVVARVYLLLRSLQPIAGYSNSKTYQLGQKTLPARNDGFLRRVLSTSVQMRNAMVARQ